MKRVPVGDGFYVKALPADLETPMSYVDRGVTWRYDGQQTYPYEVVRRSSTLVERRSEPRSPRVTIEDKLLGSTRIDSFGRHWTAIAVDEVAVLAQVAEYDRVVRDQFGEERASEAPFSNSSSPDWHDVGGTDQLLTWVDQQCDTDDPDIFRWDADGRTLVANPMSERERKSVLLYLPEDNPQETDDDPLCSGTMVDNDTVLTAAHCMFDGNGNEIDDDIVRARAETNDPVGTQASSEDMC